MRYLAAIKSACLEFPDTVLDRLKRRDWADLGLNGSNLARGRSSSRQRSGRCDAGPAVLLLVVGILGLAAATISPSGEKGQYAVIVPPWYNAGQAIMLIQRAGGRIAAINPDSHIVIVYSKRPGFDRDLYRAGAWLVLDPMRIRGCGKALSSIPKEAA